MNQNMQKPYRNGADKIVINSILFENQKKIIELANNFGKQCVVAS